MAQVYHHLKAACTIERCPYIGRWVYRLINDGLIESFELARRHRAFSFKSEAALAFVQDVGGYDIIGKDKALYEIEVSNVPDGAMSERYIGATRYYQQKALADLIAQAARRDMRRYPSDYEPGMTFKVVRL